MTDKSAFWCEQDGPARTHVSPKNNHEKNVPSELWERNDWTNTEEEKRDPNERRKKNDSCSKNSPDQEFHRLGEEITTSLHFSASFTSWHSLTAVPKQLGQAYIPFRRLRLESAQRPATRHGNKGNRWLLLSVLFCWGRSCSREVVWIIWCERSLNVWLLPSQTKNWQAIDRLNMQKQWAIVFL